MDRTGPGGRVSGHVRSEFNATKGLSVAIDLVASMVLAIWLYLLTARGGFWWAAERDAQVPPWQGPRDAPWPAVAAVIPARDEAACVGETVSSLLRQDYAGGFG